METESKWIAWHANVDGEVPPSVTEEERRMACPAVDEGVIREIDKEIRQVLAFEEPVIRVEIPLEEQREVIEEARDEAALADGIDPLDPDFLQDLADTKVEHEEF
jgi:hypothetical protein